MRALNYLMRMRSPNPKAGPQRRNQPKLTHPRPPRGCPSPPARMQKLRRGPLFRFSRAPNSTTRKASSAPVAAESERSEEHTSELQSRGHLVCRLLLEKKKKKDQQHVYRCY